VYVKNEINECYINLDAKIGFLQSDIYNKVNQITAFRECSSKQDFIYDIKPMYPEICEIIDKKICRLYDDFKNFIPRTPTIVQFVEKPENYFKDLEYIFATKTNLAHEVNELNSKLKNIEIKISPFLQYHNKNPLSNECDSKKHKKNDIIKSSESSISSPSISENKFLTSNNLNTKEISSYALEKITNKNYDSLRLWGNAVNLKVENLKIYINEQLRKQSEIIEKTKFDINEKLFEIEKNYKQHNTEILDNFKILEKKIWGAEELKKEFDLLCKSVEIHEEEVNLSVKNCEYQVIHLENKVDKFLTNFQINFTEVKNSLKNLCSKNEVKEILDDHKNECNKELLKMHAIIIDKINNHKHEQLVANIASISKILEQIINTINEKNENLKKKIEANSEFFKLDLLKISREINKNLNQQMNKISGDIKLLQNEQEKNEKDIKILKNQLLEVKNVNYDVNSGPNEFKGILTNVKDEFIKKLSYYITKEEYEKDIFYLKNGVLKFKKIKNKITEFMRNLGPVFKNFKENTKKGLSSVEYTLSQIQDKMVEALTLKNKSVTKPDNEYLKKQIKVVKKELSYHDSRLLKIENIKNLHSNSNVILASKEEAFQAYGRSSEINSISKKRINQYKFIHKKYENKYVTILRIKNHALEKETSDYFSKLRSWEKKIRFADYTKFLDLPCNWILDFKFNVKNPHILKNNEELQLTDVINEKNRSRNFWIKNLYQDFRITLRPKILKKRRYL